MLISPPFKYSHTHNNSFGAARLFKTGTFKAPRYDPKGNNPYSLFLNVSTDPDLVASTGQDFVQLPGLDLILSDKGKMCVKPIGDEPTTGDVALLVAVKTRALCQKEQAAKFEIPEATAQVSMHRYHEVLTGLYTSALARLFRNQSLGLKTRRIIKARKKGPQST